MTAPSPTFRQLKGRVGQRVRELREQRIINPVTGKHLSLRGMESLIQYSAGSLGEAERGERLIPLAKLEEIMRLAQVTPDEQLDIVGIWHEARDAEEPARRLRRPSIGESSPPTIGKIYGREESLQKLTSQTLPALSSTGSSHRICLYGPRGYGKTRLALAYFHRHRSLGRAGAGLVWWVDATARTKALTDLRRFARDRGLHYSSAEDLVGAVHGYLRTCRNWLVVFDGAIEPSDIADLLPEGPGTVLLTSWNDEWAGYSELFPLTELSNEAAVALLTDVSGRTDTQLELLAEDLWCVPLFLTQAGVFLKTTSERECSIGKYRALLRERVTAVLDWKPQAPGYPHTGAAAYTILFDSMTNPVAGDLLTLCAFLSQTDIPLDLFASSPALTVLPSELKETFAEPVTLYTSVQLLRSKGLAQGGVSSLSVHESTQVLRRASLGPEMDSKWVKISRQLVASLLPDDMAFGDENVLRLLPHAERAVEPDAIDKADAVVRVSLFRRVRTGIRSTYSLADSHSALETGRTLMLALPRHHIERAYLSLELGCGIGEHWTDSQAQPLARQLFEEGLQEARAVRSRAARLVEAELLNELARLKHFGKSSAEWREAKALFWRSISIFRKLDGQEGGPVARGLSNLAALQTDAGQPIRAEILLWKAYRIDLANLGPNHELVSLRLHNIAWARYTQALQERKKHAFEDADRQFEQAHVLACLAARDTRRALGRSAARKHPWYAHRLRLVAQIQAAQGELRRALSLLHLAQAVMIRGYGQMMHAEVGRVVGLRADVSLQAGRHREALRYARRALEIDLAVYEPNSAQITRSIERLRRIEDYYM